VIDWARVAMLKSDLGEEGFAEVLGLFLEEMAGQALRLSTLREAPARLANELHGLRGAAANLGLTELSELCGAAERAARAGSLPDTGAVCAAWERARTALLDGLAASDQIRNCASVSSLVISR